MDDDLINHYPLNYIKNKNLVDNIKYVKLFI